MKPWPPQTTCAQLVRPDIASLLVRGAGPVGLGVVALATLLLGADVPVLVANVAPYHLALAEQLGGRPIHLGETDLVTVVRDGGSGVIDVAIDTSGKAVARRGALDVIAKRGALVCVGYGEDHTARPHRPRARGPGRRRLPLQRTGR